MPRVDQCWSYFNYQIVEASFNISSDIFVLAIAIPILFKLQVPPLQRAILLTIFGMGIFIIAAALLTKLYSLYPPLLTYAYLNWYCREASVCIYVTNLPAIWTLLLDIFPVLRRWGYHTKNQSSSERASQNRTSRAPGGKEYPLQQFSRLGSTGGSPDNDSDSQEHIVEHEKGPHAGLHINKDITFTVQREAASHDDVRATTQPHSDQHVETPNGRYMSNCSAV